MAATTKLKLLRETKEDEKLAPQAQVIYDVLKGIGVGKEVDKETVLKQIEAEGKLKTRQPVERIVAYYLMPFKKEGLVEVIKPAAEPKPAKKADKKDDKSSPANAAPKPEKAAPAGA